MQEWLRFYGLLDVMYLSSEVLLLISSRLYPINFSVGPMGLHLKHLVAPKSTSAFLPLKPTPTFSSSSRTMAPKGPSKYQCVSKLFVSAKDLTSVLQGSVLRIFHYDTFQHYYVCLLIQYQVVILVLRREIMFTSCAPLYITFIFFLCLIILLSLYGANCFTSLTIFKKNELSNQWITEVPFVRCN
jgi:hypothetical protein